MKLNGTKIVENFDSLDNSIKDYLQDPTLEQDGRKLIKDQFAGFAEKSSSDRITERIVGILNGGNGRI